MSPSISGTIVACWAFALRRPKLFGYEFIAVEPLRDGDWCGRPFRTRVRSVAARIGHRRRAGVHAKVPLHAGTLAGGTGLLVQAPISTGGTIELQPPSAVVTGVARSLLASRQCGASVPYTGIDLVELSLVQGLT
jgi:hypothetical protein